MLRGTKIAGLIALVVAVGFGAYKAGTSSARSTESPKPSSTVEPVSADSAYNPEQMRQIFEAKKAQQAEHDRQVAEVAGKSFAAAPAQPQPRSGGKLTAREMDAIKAETKAATAHQEAVDAKIKLWTAKDPGARAIERMAADIATWNASANLRSTLLLRRIAAEHDLAVECFVGLVNDEGRKRCGEKLWAFDGKTGEISLAPKAEPAK